MTAASYSPYEPLNVPKPFAEEVWLVEGPEIGFDWYGLKLPFPTRMTIVRLSDGGLWLHSPTAPDPTLLDALGPVTDLVAPNTIHYGWLLTWAERFPRARAWIAPGVKQRAKRHAAGLPAHRELGPSSPPEWGGAFEQAVVPGDIVTEVVFFDQRSRTLILTDLIENLETDRVRNPLYRLAIRLAGAAAPDGQAPVDLRKTFWRHMPDVRAAVRRMLAWAPERIILAHGRCHVEDGTARLRRGLRWAL
jgi:Domain of unknown function (DUF4336)